jgi:hypothetical protein
MSDPHRCAGSCVECGKALFGPFNGNSLPMTEDTGPNPTPLEQLQREHAAMRALLWKLKPELMLRASGDFSAFLEAVNKL